MQPAEKILDEAQKQQVDIVGLSGLITPSLDEMVYVAEEMEKRGIKIPLLIGGATTSRVHTAVKIAEKYSGDVIHVLDASKAVSVASNLLGEHYKKFSQKIKEEYVEVREGHANRQSEKRKVSYSEAVKNKVPIEWEGYEPPKPSFLGIKQFENYSLNEIRNYIDWTPFFSTWMLKGKYPKIFDDKVVGEEARKLYEEANRMLDQIIEEKALQANASIGFFGAQSDGDDVLLFNEKGEHFETLHFLRQQGKKGSKIPNLSLADYIAPKNSGKMDYIGGFAVTAGLGIDAITKKFEEDHDDYNSIMTKAVADRLAEAFAELMHEKVRKEYWGYAANEAFDNESLIKEKYQGIRPAPGYPACPDHTEKDTLFNLIKAEEVGLKLTESFAMLPAASVSGFYFSHPECKYFGLGKIYQDQIKEYAQRKGMDLEVVERWLAPVLGYK
jgi:5-methyltetrahydrofolate--homocysteine methyltransferase